MREFFENLEIDMDCIWSTVKGTEIALDQRKLGHLLEMQCTEIHVPEVENDFEGLRRILGRDYVEKQIFCWLS